MKKTFLFVILFCIYNVVFAQTVFSIRSDGTILKSGQPFFPMGFYLDRADVASYTSLVTSLAAGGTYNVINLPSGSGDWNAFLNHCSSKGIYILSQLDYTGDFIAPVYTYKNHSAMYGWSVADDADNGYFTVAQLWDRHNQLKAADPNHITETSLTGYYLNRRQAADTFTAIADVAGYQCYPITPYSDYDVTPINALTETYLRTLLYVNSSAKVNRPMIMTNQAFNWGNGSSRFPTVAEERNMVYSGLAAGVKGIVSYVYNTEFLGQTSLLNECNTLSADIATLQGVLLNGTLTRVNTGDQELVESYWVYNNMCYIVMVNTSYSSSKNVSMALPSGYTGNKTSLFSRMPNTLSVFGTSLAGSIAALEVQVCSIALCGGSGDVTAPSVPTALGGNPVAQTSFTLYWAASTDNVGVTGYEVFKGGVSVGTTTNAWLDITGLTCNTAYSMSVKARDAAGNWSAASAAFSQTTSACSSGTTYYRIKSHGYNYYLFDNGNQLGYGTNADTDYSTHWIIESVSGYSCLKNRSTGHYINIETMQSYAECTTLPNNYWSAQWTLVDVSGYKVIKNRWKSTESLNIANLTNYVQHSANYPSGYWDGEWLFETTLKSTSISTGVELEADMVHNEVYPNPVNLNSQLSIRSGSDMTSTVVISDIQGRIVYTCRFKSQLTICPFEIDLKTGLYMVRVESESKTSTCKLLIN